MIAYIVVVEFQWRVFADPLDHPVERQVGKAGVLVTAADIGMNAGEPHLLDDLVAVTVAAFGTLP